MLQFEQQPLGLFEHDRSSRLRPISASALLGYWGVQLLERELAGDAPVDVIPDVIPGQPRRGAQKHQNASEQAGPQTLHDSLTTNA